MRILIIGGTGEGTPDGQGEAWWHWKKLQQAAAKTLYDAECDGVPVERRIYGSEEAALRPQFLQAIGCRNVLIEGRFRRLTLGAGRYTITLEV